jgi:SAM-dependent methyltransferase
MVDSRAFEFTQKYESAGRLGGFLIDRFYCAVTAALHEALPAVATSTVAEVGAGDGYSTRYLRRALPPPTTLIASELREDGVQAVRRLNPEVLALCQSVYQLSHPDKSFDAVVCLEVLEHLDDPAAALAELCRVCRGALVLSVPREPIWRALNMARLKYWSDLGNTPGHIQHWSTRSFSRLVGRSCEIISTRQPLPWTVLVARPRQ